MNIEVLADKISKHSKKLAAFRREYGSTVLQKIIADMM